MAKIEDILKTIDTKPMIDRISQEYARQGYIGRFPSTLRTTITGTTIQFWSARYGWFMLHGRGPGKQPPIAAIRDWIDRYNIPRNEWAVAKKIAREGTRGNNFLSPIVPELIDMISKEILQKAKEQKIWQR